MNFKKVCLLSILASFMLFFSGKGYAGGTLETLDNIRLEVPNRFKVLSEESYTLPESHWAFYFYIVEDRITKVHFLLVHHNGKLAMSILPETTPETETYLNLKLPLKRKHK